MTNEELVIRIRNHIDVDDNILQLWQQNTGMIAQMAHKYRFMAEKEDLQQEGYIALCDAVDHYTPERGGHFSTVLFQYLQAHLMRYCQNNGSVRIPVYALESVREYQKTLADLQQQAGRKVTDSDICRCMGIDEERLMKIRQIEQMTMIGSTDNIIADDDETTVGDMIPDKSDFESDVLDQMEQKELQRAIWPLVDSLPGKQGVVLRMRYQENIALKSAGEVLGCSYQLVQQIQKDALRQLRRPKNARLLRPFLPEAQYADAYQGNGVQCFNRTWTSSTERVALNLIN